MVGRDDAHRLVTAQARWFVYSGQLLDTLEMDNATAIRACTHGGHTGLRNQIGIYLYDDFAFYRGLVGDLIRWSATACMVPEPVDDDQGGHDVAGGGPRRRPHAHRRPHANAQEHEGEDDAQRLDPLIRPMVDRPHDEGRNAKRRGSQHQVGEAVEQLG